MTVSFQFDTGFIPGIQSVLGTSSQPSVPWPRPGKAGGGAPLTASYLAERQLPPH